MNTKEKIIKARTALLMDHPFWGCLAIKLELQEAPWCQTAATDGRVLYYNPDFIESLKAQQVVGLLAHEVGHCANGHVWRGEGKDHDKWNVAADYSINDILLGARFELPDKALHDSAYKNMSVEEIFHKLPNEAKGQGGKGKGKGGAGSSSGNGTSGNQTGPNGENGSDPGQCGGIIQSKGKKQSEELRAEWKAAVSQAVQIGKGRGDIPANMMIQIQEVLDPPLPWYVLLRDFVEKCARNDYRWNVPSRRYLSQGIILPSLLSEELPEVILADDTSGSTYHLQSDFSKEFSAVLAAYHTTVRVIYCDAEVHGEETYTTDDLPIKLQPKGGGGTSFEPVFEYVEQKSYMPACMIFLTDGYGTFPQHAPPYPVMWVVPKGTQVKFPFGEVVEFNKMENNG